MLLLNLFYYISDYKATQTVSIIKAGKDFVLEVFLLKDGTFKFCNSDDISLDFQD